MEGKGTHGRASIAARFPATLDVGPPLDNDPAWSTRRVRFFSSGSIVTPRDLPWRKTRDPYAVWVSEVMLQQTRVDTVIPYYTRFLARFPDAHALAHAKEDDVLALWSGLGYYRRARLLQSGVRDVVARYGGEVPRDPEARLGLPGVGRYTAGAIGSIAFDLPEPIVDGNVARVLSRVHRVETPLGRADTEKRLWEEATRWAFGPRPGALNQALMELGATVCTPTSPKCDVCPLAFACRARKDGVADSLPVARAKKAPVPKSLVALVIASSDDDPEVLLVRSGEALFGGLFGVPTLEAPAGMARGADDASVAFEAWLTANRVKAELEPEACGAIEHVLSHRRLEVRVFRANLTGASTTEDRRVLRMSALDTIGVSRLTRKILEAARLGVSAISAPKARRARAPAKSVAPRRSKR